MTRRIAITIDMDGLVEYAGIHGYEKSHPLFATTSEITTLMYTHGLSRFFALWNLCPGS